MQDETQESCDEDDDDDEDDDEAKIPKKTEIFEGQVVLVKEDGDLLSQHASVQKKPTGRTRLLKAQIRRDRQRLNFEKKMIEG